MYRIEVKPGEETVFRTIDELATGIRNGFITPRARIYHAASQKWLPIEFHPHYKKALEGNFTPTAASPQPSLAAMPTPTFSFPGATPPPAAAPVEPEGPAVALPEPPAVALPEPPEASASVVDASVMPASVAAPPAPPPRAEPWRRTVASTAAESPLMAMHAAVRRPEEREPEAEAGPIERYSPVAVRERPRAAPAPAPEVVLPNITYPTLPPVEQAEPRATARRSRRTGGRPLLLVGSAAVLVFAGQRYLASRGTIESAPVAEAAPPEPALADAPPTPATQPAAARAPTRAPSAATSRPPSLVPAPTQPMTPGPAFAASVPARVAPVSRTPTAPTAPAPDAAAVPPHSAPRSDSAAIAPAPTAIELDVPALLPGESIAPSLEQGRDSLAIKRILKAVTTRKGTPTAP